MYDDRLQWVPVFLLGAFFGEMYITQSIENVNSFFSGYINASRSIQVLIKQCEKAIVCRREKEVKADYNTINTMAVPSPMEKQAASIYTRKIFMKFQEELVETLANQATIINDIGVDILYRVAKYGEGHKAYFIRFNVFEKKANCSCQMFEFSGILCRHIILAVFRMTNLLTLPSHYILKRWMRNLGLENNPQESFTACSDNLITEAIKYVEDGADSVHVYHVAVNALREAARKVAAAKQNTPSVVQSTQIIKWNQGIDVNEIHGDPNVSSFLIM